MELKVWVEGIQRIVCGVNDKTTCQDVVYALAHATGKTGRFTLIERWRNSERLLAPNEQPLKVLLKWGEHSNDVQFILQWSPLDSGGSKLGPTKAAPVLSDGFSHNDSSHSPSPFSGKYNHSNSYSNSPNNVGHGNSNPPIQPNGPTKRGASSSASLFSSNESRNNHSVSDIVGNNKRKDPNNVVGVVRGIPQRNSDMNNHQSNMMMHNSSSPTSSSPSLSEFSGNPNGKVISGGMTMSGPLIQGNPKDSSSTKLKDFNLSSPPPYREPPNPHNNSPVGGLSSKGLLPPYREPPPPNLNHHPNHLQQRLGNNNSPVLMQQHPGNNSSASSSVQGSPSVLGSGNHSAFNNTNSSSNVISPNNVSQDNHSSGSNISNSASNSKDSPRLPPHHTQESIFNSPSDKSDSFTSWKNKDHLLTNGDIPSSNQNGSVPKQSPISNSNPQYKDLVRLINLQREKLTSQQAELTQYDAEIMFWEGKAREQQRHMEFITKEIARLELVSAQHESQVLSLAHLEEENEFVKQESDVLKTELGGLRTELTKCENELLQCKNRIRLLMDELHSSQMQMNQRQEEWVQREANTLAEIERLKKELDVARRETDAVSDLSGSLDKEVHSLEANLSEKKKQMERLVAAMKEANLQSLTIHPPDEVIDGATHHRSGSTRRMIGSPRQLENAAPTSKNPHGVWV